MSHKLISRSPDLKRLRDEGYDLSIRSGFLLVDRVPYLNSQRELKYGTLVSKLTLAGDVTSAPEDHVAYFRGEYPCRHDGQAIDQIRNQSARKALAESVEIDHTFSAKPQPSGKYEDYYSKVSTYVAILSGPARVINPEITATYFPPILADEEDKSPFHYLDTASSRAEIDLVTRFLSLDNVAIVGLGGTGSYVLDLVAKTPVKRLHLFDGDLYLQHNAFRSPGAPSICDLQMRPAKTEYLTNIYSRMHRGIVGHAVSIDAENVSLLEEMDFVFVCIDRGSSKQVIVDTLEHNGIPFIDVGMGIELTGDNLGGIIRVTACSPGRGEHLRTRISYDDRDGENAYDSNIQVADLNALNAALAVIKWKKMFGFYRDLEMEHHCTYTIDGNILTNEDRLQ